MKDKIKTSFDSSKVIKKKKKQVQQEQEEFSIDDDKKRHDETIELLKGIKDILESQNMDVHNSAVEGKNFNPIHKPQSPINEGVNNEPSLSPFIKKDVQEQRPKKRWFFNIFKYAVIIAVFVFTGSAIYYFIHNLMRLNIIFAIIISFGISVSFSFMAKTLFGLVENRESKPLQVQSGQIHLMDDIFEKSECPKCYGKLHKSSININDGEYKQLIKCKNLNCDFQKEIFIKV